MITKIILLLTTADHEINGGGNETPSGGLAIRGAIVGTIFVLLIVLVLGVAIIAAVLLVVKHGKTGGNYSTSSNVAYTGQRTNKDIAVSQPLAESNVEMKDECFVTSDTTANESSKYQPLTTLYDTIDESQLTVADVIVPRTDEELHRNIETSTDNQFPQPSTSVLYDTIDENTTEVLQSSSEPSAALSTNDIKAESELPTATENVAYDSSYPSSEGAPLTAVNLVQNVAYKPTTVSLLPNIAYESSKYQQLTALYDTIDESQLTVVDVPKTDKKVLHRNIETSIDNEFLQPSTSVLYDTIDDNMTEVLQSGSEPPAALSMNEFPDTKAETELPITTENVAYNSSYLGLKAQQPCEGALLTAVNLDNVQNVAYKPTSIPLLPNVAYESHVHQGIENQDEYDYINLI